MKHLGVTYQARLGMDPDTHVVFAAARLDALDPIAVNWFAAPVFPAPQAGDDIVDFSGRWIGEFQMNHTVGRRAFGCVTTAQGARGTNIFRGLCALSWGHKYPRVGYAFTMARRAGIKWWPRNCQTGAGRFSLAMPVILNAPRAKHLKQARSMPVIQARA
jgi:hypothetical protein